MTETAERLRQEVLQLPNPECAELAYCLIRSLDEDDAELQAAWEAELERRWRDMESGNAPAEPTEAVFAELRKKYP